MESRNWINGEWVTPTGDVQTVYNPSKTDEEVGVLHLSQELDMLQAGEAARRSLPHWARLTGPQRGNLLYRTAELFQQNTGALATLASIEMGKPVTEMKGEVMRAVNLLKYYGAEGVRSDGDVIPASTANVLQYTKRVP